MDISTRIKERRKIMRFTQEQLSKLVGVSCITLRRWEAGERTPNSSLIPKLAEILNTSVEYLMGLNLDKAPASPLKQDAPEFSIKEKDLISSGKVLYYENNGKRFILPATPDNEKWFKEKLAENL